MKPSKKELNEKQWLFFYSLLQERGNESEISGKTLRGDINSCWFHHILPKSKYPELRYCPDNIIILTKEEHDEIEAGVEYELVKKRKRDIEQRFDELKEMTNDYLDNFLNPIYKHAKENTTFFNKK